MLSFSISSFFLKADIFFTSEQKQHSSSVCLRNASIAKPPWNPLKKNRGSVAQAVSSSTNSFTMKALISSTISNKARFPHLFGTNPSNSMIFLG